MYCEHYKWNLDCKAGNNRLYSSLLGCDITTVALCLEIESNGSSGIFDREKSKFAVLVMLTLLY